ncbi:MAG: hypothetical protein ACLVHY_05490 [Gemmiger sp.]
MGQLFSPQESRSTSSGNVPSAAGIDRAGRVRLDETGTLTMDRARRPRNKQNQPLERPQPMPITQRKPNWHAGSHAVCQRRTGETDRLAEAMRADRQRC